MSKLEALTPAGEETGESSGGCERFARRRKGPAVELPGDEVGVLLPLSPVPLKSQSNFFCGFQSGIVMTGLTDLCASGVLFPVPGNHRSTLCFYECDFFRLRV